MNLCKKMHELNKGEECIISYGMPCLKRIGKNIIQYQKVFLEEKMTDQLGCLDNDVEREEDVDLEIARNEIISYPASFSLSEYTKKLDNQVFFNPEFQRNYVWDNKRKSRFIESLLCDFPIPQVFLYKVPKQEKYMIVDGFQRISTIHAFLKGNFQLTDVSSSLVGKTIFDLSEDDQEMLSNKQISAVIVRQIQPNDESVLYNLFERLNTGGQNLNNMEVRRAINFGPLIKMLEELNLDENWRSILGRKDPDPRFSDVELILRLLAFSDSWDNKEKKLINFSNLKGFLNHYCSEHRDEKRDSFKKLFVKTTKLLVVQLGEKPFTLFSRPNYVLLDSIMTALLIKKKENLNLQNKVQKLKQDESFKTIYEAKQGTLSAKTINTRIAIALEFLQ